MAIRLLGPSRLVRRDPGQLEQVRVVGVLRTDRQRLLEVGERLVVGMELDRPFGGATQGETGLDRDRLALFALRNGAR